MSTVLKPIITEREQNNISIRSSKKDLATEKSLRCGIKKCKENIFKHKCSKDKALKNKLKKYKLRRDGKEDPEVLNVSQIFQCSLKIKSPNNNNSKELNIWDSEVYPRNYLFKMARRKRITDKATTVKSLLKEIPKDKSLIDKIVNAEPEHVEMLTPNSQEKKHTNAFQLMMESRNKSIGSNSPGKQKTVDEDELLLLREEKNKKAKRLLVLQKMAEAKGSLKKKEKDELEEEAIKRKMERRAERLTNMLVNNSKAKVKAEKEQSTSFDTNIKEKSPVLNKKQSDNKKDINAHSIGTLQVIDIFNENSEPVQNGTNAKCLSEKQISKEDSEFLKKLSPSIRKKENMLSYFKKIDKNDESFVPIDSESTEHNSPVIKVKFATRSKNKLKKKKLSLNSDELLKQDENKKTEDAAHDTNHPTDNMDQNSNSDSRKRKRGQAAEGKNMHVSENLNKSLNSEETNESNIGRPKRNIKKPIQYTDFDLSSSDEEYNIFTPKKKKQTDKTVEVNEVTKVSTLSGIASNKSVKNNVKDAKKPVKKNNVKEKCNVKLAPIFTPKPQLDPAALEAKQKFLHSGVPDKLKKISIQQAKVETQSNCFPTVVHVQQKESHDNVQSSRHIDLLKYESDSEYNPVECPGNVFKSILSPEKPKNNTLILKSDTDVREVLKFIKLSYPKFPVYRTYNLLKGKSKGEFFDINTPELDNSVEILNNFVDSGKIHVDKLNWTDKYKPIATNQIIGNFETTKELKKWLEFWTVRGKANERTDSDSSDFCYSDADSKDSMKTTDNLLILTGPTGCGKTSCVYAVAADLAIKVIEVNASSKRNSKIMLQDLQEATQSHKVNRTKGNSAENSQKSQEIVEVDLTIKVKKRGRPKKSKDVAKPKEEAASQSSNSQENVRTSMSLILIDDADIIFDQDEGFCSAISQLIQYSKRPVILVTTSLACPHLQRFLSSGKIMIMKPLLSRMLGTWLDIMCLADSGTGWPGLGAMLLDLFKGDIRKTKNCLQFYVSACRGRELTQEEKCSLNSEILYDENSSMSWAGSENQEDRNTACAKIAVHEADFMLKYFMEIKSNLLHVQFPSDLWNVWWNLPILLNNVFDCKEVTAEPDDKEKSTHQLSKLAIIADNLSVADYFTRLRPDTKTNISSQPWYSSECDSSSEYENLVSYNKSHDLSDDLSKTLVVRSICNAQKCLGCNEKLYLQPTRMTVQR